MKKFKNFIASILSLVVGAVIGFAFNVYNSIPESYEIPTRAVVVPNASTNSNINIETVESEDLSIHFLELGNKYTGDSTLIKVGNTEMLIDAGSKANSVPVLKEYIDQYCEDGTLEYVVVTHAHEDHYAGFATNNFNDSLFYHYEVETIIEFAKTNKTEANKMYKNYLDNKTEEGSTVLKATDCLDKTYNLGEISKNVTFEILDQKFYRETADTENDYSVCLQITHNEKKFLFTGDLEKEGEESLVELNALSPVEVYKAGHHGSKTSSTETLIDIIQPKVVCVCCCAGSSEYTSKTENQFPTQKLIDVVTKYPCSIYVTTLCVDFNTNKFESLNGDIVICSTGTEIISIQCSNSSLELRETEWFKQNRKLTNE